MNRIRLLALTGAALIPVTIGASATRTPAGSRAIPADSCAVRSADWLGLLPDGIEKRAFVLDCTGCHQLDSIRTLPGGAHRTESGWNDAVTRMLGYAGATTGFPVIAADRDPAQTARWLARSIADRRPARSCAPGMPAGATVTEYRLPEAADLAHDVAVDSSGRVIVTGMFTHALWVLDSVRGTFEEVAIPVTRANPRALDLDAQGNWWAVLGSPHRIARYAPQARTWQSWDVGMYPHSLAPDTRGRVWFNGHFTKSPEQIGYVDAATGAVTTFDVPAHPTLASQPGGPIPYEIRVGPDGHVWLSELQGNRVVEFNPDSRAFRAFDMPLPRSGPRRLDIDAAGVVWIPAYAANALVRLDPRTGTFTSFDLPVPNAVPYVVRVDQASGTVWIGNGAVDAVFAFDPRTRRFTSYPLPSEGVMIRHMAVDARRGNVWLAYGASPGIPARIARLHLGRRP